VGGTLGAIASLITIVSFVTGHGSPQPSPTPIQTTQAGSVSVPGTSNPADSPSPTGMPSPTGTAYPASAQSSYLSNCGQNVSGPSFCQCTLSWFEANVPYSQFTPDMAKLEQYEQGQTDQPPQDVTEAYAACTTNGN
jgi:hypothetical protein